MQIYCVISLGPRSVGTALLGPLSELPQSAIKVSAELWLVDLGVLSKLIQVADRIQVLEVVGLMPFSIWLLAGSPS